MVAVPCQYRIGAKLGSGSYASVHEVRHIETGEYFACKVINKRLMKGHEKMIVNEIRIMEQISKGSPHIVTLQDYFETVNSLYIVTDLCRGGELFDRICDKKYFHERDAAKLIKIVCEAVAYLHDHGIVHRDLKPENLLFESKDDDSDLKIADFGLSKIVDEQTFSALSTTCGTPSYMAPEIFMKEGYGMPVDMWAVGVITYFLLCGYTPFDSDDGNQAEEIEAVCHAKFDFTPAEYWKDVSETARSFVRACLTVDPSARLTARAALSHAWLSPPATEEPPAPEANLVPNFRHHADVRQKLSRSLSAIKAMSHMRHDADLTRRKSKREQMSEAFRRVVDRVDAARQESEIEAMDLDSLRVRTRESVEEDAKEPSPDRKELSKHRRLSEKLSLHRHGSHGSA